MDREIIKKGSLVLVLLLAIMARRVNAQETENDTWLGAELSKKLTKKVSLNFKPLVRFTEDYKVDAYFFEAGVDYKLFKFLNVGGSYRFFINERETKSTEYFSRFTLDAEGKYSLRNLDVKLRTRYTNYSVIDADDDDKQPFLRYRLKLKYNIQKLKLSPYVAMELFHQLNESDITKTRKTIGLDYKIDKHQKVGLEYLMQYYKDDDFQRNILYLKYKIAF